MVVNLNNSPQNNLDSKKATGISGYSAILKKITAEPNTSKKELMKLAKNSNLSTEELAKVEKLIDSILEKRNNFDLHKAADDKGTKFHSNTHRSHYNWALSR